MPYEPDSEATFPLPSDETRLWRYMDVVRFLAVLQGPLCKEPATLYFARKSQFSDRLEGTRPTTFTKLIDTVIHPDEAPGVKDFLDTKAEQAVVSCWHASEEESSEMWERYTSGREGVAIQTTVGRLKRALRDEICRVRIAEVKYGRHESDYVGTETLHLMATLTFKDQSYSYEKEVRAIVLSPAQRELARHGRGPLPELFSGETGNGDGLLVNVDLAELVERIVVSPHFPGWAVAVLQAVVDCAKLPVRVEPSGLL